MVFDNNMYRLQLAEELQGKRAKTAEVEHPILSLQMMLPSLMDDVTCMQCVHDTWAHPSESMALRNYKHWHGKGFQLDFKELLPRTSCLVCPFSKGARQYKHTAAFNEKGQQHVPLQHAGTLEVEEDDVEVTMGDTTPEPVGSDGR
eukprot:3940534-Rhodomonas_salina.1